MKNTKDMQEQHGTRRREFLTKSAKVAAVAPAVALLLSQTSMPAHAQQSGVSKPPSTPPNTPI
jgi:hypothetical protein